MGKERKTTMITKQAQNKAEFASKREQAQKLNFAAIQEVLQRNVSRVPNKTFTQYTKDLLKTYIQNPMSNQDTFRDISRFLTRVSLIYKKILQYQAAMPLYYYNITQNNDLTKVINGKNALKDYMNVLTKFDKFNLAKEMYTASYLAFRDGFYVGFMYDSEDDGLFLMPLDVQYCRIYGKTPEGEWIVYFNAAYFDTGNNKEFVTGINEDKKGVWDKCFVDGYNQYKTNGRDYQWFRLDQLKTFCLLSCSEDEFEMPLPYWLPIFTSLLDLIDLEQIIASKTELENYVLLLSKIPLVPNSDDVDDFALSLELVQQLQALIDQVVPELVGTAYTAMDVDVITFDKSNTSDDTNSLSDSMNNLFSNAGISQMVVSSGSSTNSVGLKHAIQNDQAIVWTVVNRIEAWLNYYIKVNYATNYHLQIHKITWYNQDEYQSFKKDAATLGGSALDFLTACGDTPYAAMQKIYFENAIGIKQIMVPLMSSYNTSSELISDNKGGRPAMDDDDLTENGAASRDKDWNGTETI